MAHLKPFRSVMAITALILFFGCASSSGAREKQSAANGAKSSGKAAASKKAPENPGPSPSATYVGSQVCQACHQQIYDNLEKSPHFKATLDTHVSQGKGCEGCHGPGSEHVAEGGDPTKIFIFADHSTKEIDDRCTTCHAGGPEHMNALSSVHSENGVSCISCHSPHHATSPEFLLTKAQPELCYTCHLQQKSQFAMPFHHRVNEGLIQCTDCHNPHGTEGPKQVRMAATQDAVCYSCHAEKQGPFVFEHAPLKVNGCQSCHVPHGGPNAHMLKVSNVNLLCLQCHTTSSFSSAPGAPSFHNQASFFQACTLCHVAIHGSNFDATFFK